MTSASPQAPVKRTKINVYFLAAPEDQDDCKAVKKHLTPVVRNSKIPIEIHSDFEIPIGEDTEQYKQKLFEADIVLAFISADYINDDDIYARTQKVIEKYNKNETIMLPILVRNCLWKSTPFVNLPLLPKNIQPLNNKKFWNSEDDALTSVVNDINDSIRSFSYEEKVEEPPKAKPTSEPEKTVTEQAPPKVETEPAIQPKPEFVAEEFVIERPKSQIKANVPLEVDWRKKYYKNVLWKRGLAFFLDQFLVLLPAYALPFFLGGLFLGDNFTDAMVEDLVFPAILFYFIVCAFLESSKWHGTPGKRVLKLQITDRDGNPISFFRAFVRNISRLVVGYLYLMTFGILLIVQYFTFKKSKKLFHDQLTSTVIGERLN